jgi:hypothetical protein
MQLHVCIRKSRKHDFVEAMTKYFIQQLGLKSSAWACTVRTYRNFTKDTGGSSGGANYTPGHVEVALDSRLNASQIVLVLAHEMIHVRQMARGKLRYEGDIPFWCGKDASHFEYDDRPWEKQAYKEMFDLIRGLAGVFPVYMKTKSV